MWEVWVTKVLIWSELSATLKRSWVCVLVHFVVKNIHGHGVENEKGILGFGFWSVRVKIQSGGRVYRRKCAERDDCK